MKNLSHVYAGEKSYPVILENIKNFVLFQESNTIEGKKILETSHKILNESHSPLLDLHEFFKNDLEVVGNNTTLGEIVDFMKKETTGGDLNFLINLAKEEHYKNLNRLGVNYDGTTGDDTLKSLESYWGEPESVLEKLVKEGTFNGLKSEIAKDAYRSLNDEGKADNKINKDFGTEQDDLTKLNESFETILDLDSKNDLVAYSPIGVGVEDLESNNVCILSKFGLYRLNNTNGLYREDESLTDKILTAENRKVLDAINHIEFDPSTDEFSLSDKWDFDMILNKDIVTNETIIKLYAKGNAEDYVEIPRDELKDFLFESLNQINPNDLGMIREADRFMLLADNLGTLIKLNDVIVVENQTANKYVVFDKTSELVAPKLIDCSLGHAMEFPTYTEMLGTIQNVLETSNLEGKGILEYFQSKLDEEKTIALSKQEELRTLEVALNNASTKIKELNGILTIADPESEIYKSTKAELETVNADYSEMVKRNSELTISPAYYHKP